MIQFKHFETICETEGDSVIVLESGRGSYINPDYKQNTILAITQLQLFFKKNPHIEFVSLTEYDTGLILTYSINENIYYRSKIDFSIDELYKFNKEKSSND